jgi:excisionase family DNA binding protein
VGVHEAAEFLGVNPYTVRRNIGSDEIRAVRVERRVLTPTEELERVLADGVGPRI